MFEVILYQPEIPPNTGNIIRLCANTGARLHLIRPLGFELDDKQLKRAGLDYHEYASLKVHDSLPECLQTLPQARHARLPHPNPDGTTSHSTDVTTSHPTKQPKDGCKVVGYKPASGQVAGYPPEGAPKVGNPLSGKPNGELTQGTNASLRELSNTLRLFAFTTKASHPFHEVQFRKGDALLFGPESRGLPSEVLESLAPEQRLCLPMLPNNRSLNLSNTVAVAVYEAWRQCGFEGEG